MLLSVLCSTNELAIREYGRRRSDKRIYYRLAAPSRNSAVVVPMSDFLWEIVYPTKHHTVPK